MVDSDGELGSLTGSHNELLELLLSDLEGLNEGEDVVDRDGVVDLGELLEEPRKDDVSDGGGVLRVVGGREEGGDDGRGGGADGEGVEIDLEEGIERSEGGGHSGEDVSVELKRKETAG